MSKGTQTPVPPLADEDREWLVELNEQIWRDSDQDRFGRVHSFEERELTRKEWTRVKRLVRAHALPCEMHSGPYGGLWIRIFAPPAAPGAPAEYILAVGQENIPGFKKIGGGYVKRHPAAWRALSPLTHSPRNQELLELFGLEQSRASSYYEY